MAYTHWFVKAVVPTPGFNALLKPTTLIPKQRGRMLCAAAETAAGLNEVIMLSPGGVKALAAHIVNPGSPAEAPQVEHPIVNPVPRSPGTPRGPQARKSA